MVERSLPRTFGVGEGRSPLLTNVVAVLPCPIAVVSGQDGRILARNGAWARAIEQAEPAGGAVDRALGALFPGAAMAFGNALPEDREVLLRAVERAVGPGGVATWWDLDFVPHPDDADAVLVTARDVTECVLAGREAEDARDALEPIGTRLRLAQAAAGIGTWEWDAAADRQAWSPEQFRLHGVDPATRHPPSFEEWMEMVLPEDRPKILGMLERDSSRSEDRARQFEFRIRRSDTGEVRWLLSLARVMSVGPAGRPLRMLGVNLDVTAQRAEQEALRASEAMLRLAGNAANVFAWDWDVATGRVAWADGLERALGFPPGGFAGSIDAFRALVHPDDAPFVEASLQRAFSGETSEYRAEFRMRCADGNLRWTATRGIVLRDEAGRPVRVVGTDHDITEIKAVQATLCKREAQQAAVAQLGQFALTAASAQAVMHRAVEIMAEIFEVEYTKVLELQPGGQSLQLRAGRGWKPEYADGGTTVSAGRRSQAGFTLLRNSGPVFVADLRTEQRFDGPALLHDHDVVSGISVVIRNAEDAGPPFGVPGNPYRAKTGVCRVGRPVPRGNRQRHHGRASARAKRSGFAGRQGPVRRIDRGHAATRVCRSA